MQPVNWHVQLNEQANHSFRLSKPGLFALLTRYRKITKNERSWVQKNNLDSTMFCIIINNKDMQILNDSIVFFFVLKIVANYPQRNHLFTTGHSVCLNLSVSVASIFSKASIGWNKAFLIFRYQFSTSGSVYINTTVVYPIHSAAKK